MRCPNYRVSNHCVNMALALGVGFTIAIAAPSPTPAQTLDQQFFEMDLDGGAYSAERDEADRIRQAGDQQYQTRQLPAAIAQWQRALEIYRQIGDEQAMNVLYHQIGTAYVELGQWSAAEDALRRRLALTRDGGDRLGQIDALNDLGILLVQQRHFALAQPLFEESLTLAQTVGNIGGEAVAFSNLGLLAAEAGKYSEAIALYEAALSRLDRATDPRIEATTYNRLGTSYQAIDRPADALRNYLVAHRVAAGRGDRSNHYRALDGLVATYMTQRSFAQAYAALEERFQLAQTDQNLRQQLNTSRMLAEFYMQTGDGTLARAFYRQALNLSQQLSDERSANQFLLILSNLGEE